MTKIGIVGLGYVGLPLAVAFAEAGCSVVGVDSDHRKVEAITRGESYIEDIATDRLRDVLDRVNADTDFAALESADAILICVPTPLTPNREPDLSALVSSATSISEILCHGQLVVLESTTYPGTTRERLVPILEEGGLAAGVDFHVAFSPERVDPGRTDFTLRTTPKVIGGYTEACGDRAETVYRAVCDEIVRVSTPDVAELTKLLENIFRSVNIALVNEMAMLTERMDIDIWEVIDAASTKPYGFMRFEPGPGMGGHCLPVDPFYLAWRAREFDMTTEFIELAGKVNQQMPYHSVSRIERSLNDLGKAVNGSRVGLLGVSYKSNVGDVRESPALKMIGLLRGLGAEVIYHDPHVPKIGGHDLSSCPLDEVIMTSDLVVLVTVHAAVDHGRASREAKSMLDLRGATRNSDAQVQSAS